MCFVIGVRALALKRFGQIAEDQVQRWTVHVAQDAATMFLERVLLIYQRYVRVLQVQPKLLPELQMRVILVSAHVHVWRMGVPTLVLNHRVHHVQKTLQYVL